MGTLSSPKPTRPPHQTRWGRSERSNGHDGPSTVASSRAGNGPFMSRTASRSRHKSMRVIRVACPRLRARSQGRFVDSRAKKMPGWERPGMGYKGCRVVTSLTYEPEGGFVDSVPNYFTRMLTPVSKPPVGRPGEDAVPMKLSQN
jgi:hypothetical protein